MSNVLNLYTMNSDVLNDAIDKIVIKLHGAKKKDNCKMFLFTGVGADGGTTSIAINVAISLAEAGWKTAFVDADLRKNQKYKRTDGESQASLSEFLMGNASSKSILHKTNVQNLDYVVSGEKNDNPVRLLCNAKLEAMLSELKSNYDFIIIDTPPVCVANDVEILIPLVDKYVLVVSMNDTRKRQLIDARMQLAEYEDKYLGIIANNLDMIQYKGIVKDYDYYSKGKLLIKHNKGLKRRKES